MADPGLNNMAIRDKGKSVEEAAAKLKAEEAAAELKSVEQGQAGKADSAAQQAAADVPPPVPGLNTKPSQDEDWLVRPVKGDMFDPYQRLWIRGITEVKSTNWIRAQIKARLLVQC